MKRKKSVRGQIAIAWIPLALVLALGGSLIAASAAGASTTRHWATTPLATMVPTGTAQAFTAESLNGSVTVEWEDSGALVRFSCSGLTATGTVENPSGGAARVESGPLQLTKCQVAGSTTKCEVENETINFGPFTEVSDTSGSETLATKPGVETSLKILTRAGQKCPLSGTYPIRGQIAATTGGPSVNRGEYVMEPANFTIANGSARLLAGLALKAKTGERLVQSAVWTFGVPEWYFAGPNWSLLAAGHPQPIVNSEIMGLTLKSSAFGANLEVECENYGAPGLRGTIENPTGGAAGTGTAVIAFGEGESICSVHTSGKSSVCEIHSLTSASLVATTTEVEGAPAIELSASGGASLFNFVVTQAVGAKCAVKGTYATTGKLLLTSHGDAPLSIAGIELKTNTAPTTAAGRVSLRTEAGEAVRLQ